MNCLKHQYFSQKNLSKTLLISCLVFTITVLCLNSIWALSFQSDRKDILGSQTDISSSEIISLTNLERTKAGLSTLTPNDKLTLAAMEKAQNMKLTQNFDHFYQTSAGDITPWQFIENSGYLYLYAGENLARDFSSSIDIVKAWVNSPPHRANLLNPAYSHIGVAVLETPNSKSSDYIVVQLLASPINPHQPITSPPKDRYSITPVLVAQERFLTSVFSQYPHLLLVSSVALLVLTSGLLTFNLTLIFKKSPKHAPQSSLWRH